MLPGYDASAELEEILADIHKTLADDLAPEGLQEDAHADPR